MKRKYKRKINYSYNIKKLDIVVKYIKELGSNQQKIYKYKECKSLINYIKKEGNIFQSKKKINEKNGIKHLIISPINPVEYNKLNEEQKQKIKEISKNVLFNTFFKYGFIGSIEEKERIIDNKVLEHFHIHIGINSKYDIGLKQINYIKKQIEKGFLQDTELKEVLGLKTTKELKSDTMKKTLLFKEIMKNGNTIKEHFNEIKEINNNIGILLDRKDFLINDIEKYNNNNFMLYNKIYKNKEILKYDINNVKNCIEYKKDLIKWYDKDISHYIDRKQYEKEYLYNKMNDTIKNIFNIIKNDIQGYYMYLQYTNNIQIMYYKQLLKNGKIDRNTFLSYVLNNKYYIKQQLNYYKQNKIYEIKKRKIELQETIITTLKQYDKYIEYKQELKKWKIKDIQLDYNKIEKLIKENIKLNNNIRNKIEYNRIQLTILKGIYKKIQKEIREKIQHKKLIQQQIKQKQEHNNKIKQQLNNKQENTLNNTNNNTTTIYNYDYDYLGM